MYIKGTVEEYMRHEPMRHELMLVGTTLCLKMSLSHTKGR